jgi:hypothetical protein
MSRSTCVKIVAWLVLPAVTGFGSGCSATRATAVYLKNRTMDLGDPIPFGSGLGFGASVRATNYLQLGGLVTSRATLTRGRDTYSPISTGFEGGLAPLVYFRDIGSPKAGRQGRGVLMGRTLMETSQESWDPWYGENWLWLPSREDYAANYDRHFWDFGISLYGVIGFDVVVNPIQTPFEIADFFTGIFAVDLAGDDQVWVGPRLFDTATPEEAAAIADAETPAQ